MTELQAESANVDESQHSPGQETEQPSQVSESAPDTGENQEQKTTFNEEQQRIFNEAIAKKVFKAREAEREAERLRDELEKTKAKLPQKTRPEIPGIPDSLEMSDEEYRAALIARDQAITEAAAFDERQRLKLEQQQALERQQLENAQKEFDNKVINYTQNAAKLGVTDTELAHAGRIVEAYGIQKALADHILGSEQGPLITVYLSQNQVELDAIRQLDPITAAVRIETEIKPKAAAMKAKVTSAPEPAETLNGAGVPPKQRGPKGATFE